MHFPRCVGRKESSGGVKRLHAAPVGPTAWVTVAAVGDRCLAGLLEKWLVLRSGVCSACICGHVFMKSRVLQSYPLRNCGSKSRYLLRATVVRG